MTRNMSKMLQKWHQFNEIDHNGFSKTLCQEFNEIYSTASKVLNKLGCQC